jgi:hypothetical protein
MICLDTNVVAAAINWRIPLMRQRPMRAYQCDAARKIILDSVTLLR